MTFLDKFAGFREIPPIVKHPLHNPDPSYLRELIEKIGMSQRQLAKHLDINESQFRAYLVHSSKSSHREAPYLVQFALEKMANGGAKGEIQMLMDRVLEVYRKHGIGVTQIPKFTPEEYGLTLDTLSDTRETLSKLTPKFLSWMAESFGLRLEWLETGGTERIYPFNNDYKDASRLLSWLYSSDRPDHSIRAWAFKNVDTLDKSIPHFEKGEGHVAILFAEKVELTPGNTILRYRISNYWDWNYSKSRHELKLITRICDLNGQNFFCYTVDHGDLDTLVSGTIFPEPFIQSRRGIDWHIEDYALDPSESVQAKDIDEVDRIKKYISDGGFNTFIKSEEL